MDPDCQDPAAVPDLRVGLADHQLLIAGSRIVLAGKYSRSSTARTTSAVVRTVQGPCAGAHVAGPGPGCAVGASVLELPDHSAPCLEPGTARAERSREDGTSLTISRWDGGRDQDPGSRAQGPTPPTRVGVMCST